MKRLELKKILFILIGVVTITSCQKEEIKRTTNIENKFINVSKQQKQVHYTGWLLQIFVMPGDDGMCYYYYQCIGVTYSKSIQCNPENPQTIGFKAYPMYDANGEHIKVKCDDLSIVHIEEETIIDNPSDLEQIRYAIEFMHEDGRLLVSPHDYIYCQND